MIIHSYLKKTVIFQFGQFGILIHMTYVHFPDWDILSIYLLFDFWVFIHYLILSIYLLLGQSGKCAQVIWIKIPNWPNWNITVFWDNYGLSFDNWVSIVFIKLTMDAPRISLTNIGTSIALKRMNYTQLWKLQQEKWASLYILIGSKARKGATKVEGLEALLLKNYRGAAGAYWGKDAT